MAHTCCGPSGPGRGMSITGIDSITYGVEDLELCRRFFVDWGLQQKGDNEWVVPAGAKLTESQYEAYKAGRLYVDFHSAQHKGGEIRAQIKAPAGTARSSGY